MKTGGSTILYKAQTDIIRAFILMESYPRRMKKAFIIHEIKH